MRPIHISIAPITAVANGFAADIIGVGPFTPTTASPTDDLGHLVTLTVATANFSAITFTLTGIDIDGKSITETLAGPNNNTVTGTKYFATLSSVAVSAELEGADLLTIGWSAASITKTIPLEWRSNAAAAMNADISGTINYSVQETFANVYDSLSPSTLLPWNSITAFAAKTADVTSTGTLGANAVRILTNTVTNGATVNLYISQPAGYSL